MASGKASAMLINPIRWQHPGYPVLPGKPASF
jgi:hypothetical protein